MRKWLIAAKESGSLRHWGMELVVVTVGILLAFELQAWAEGRREAKQQRDLTERLFLESEEVAAALIDERDRYGTTIKNQLTALDSWVEGGVCPKSDEAWNAFFQSGFYNAPTYPTTAYDEMIGSGGLQSLPTTRVRDAVSNFHAASRYYHQDLDYFRLGYMTRDDSYNDALEPTDIDVRGYNGVSLDVDREQACQDEEILRDIAYSVRNFVVMQRYRATLTYKALAMCTALADELGESCRPGNKALTDDDTKAAEWVLSQ